jgi:hypothetical protein
MKMDDVKIHFNLWEWELNTALCQVANGVKMSVAVSRVRLTFPVYISTVYYYYYYYYYYYGLKWGNALYVQCLQTILLYGQVEWENMNM